MQSILYCNFKSHYAMHVFTNYKTFFSSPSIKRYQEGELDLIFFKLNIWNISQDSTLVLRWGLIFDFVKHRSRKSRSTVYVIHITYVTLKMCLFFNSFFWYCSRVNDLPQDNLIIILYNIKDTVLKLLYRWCLDKVLQYRDICKQLYSR